VAVKLERRSWFFDEAGWFEVPAIAGADNEALSAQNVAEKLLLVTR